MVQLSHDFQIFADDGVTPLVPGSGSVVIKNRNNVAQETLGPAVFFPGPAPAWFVNVGANVFRIFYDLDQDALDYPGDFVILAFDLVATTAEIRRFEQVATFAGAGIPTIPTGREPYALLAEADTYFASRLGEEARWNGFSDRLKTMALITASDDVDTERYLGRKMAPLQAATGSTYTLRQWPRIIPAFTYPGIDQLIVNTDDGIPEAVKFATCQQALWLLKHVGPYGDPNDRRAAQQAGLTGMAGGGTTENWDLTRTGNDRLCPAARDLLRPFLLIGADVGMFD